MELYDGQKCTDDWVQVVNAPAFLEVGNGEVLIFIATNSDKTLASLTSVTKDYYYGASSFEWHSILWTPNWFNKAGTGKECYCK